MRLRPLPVFSAAVLLAAWSPDRETIAFVQDSTETVEVRDQVYPELYLLTMADDAIRRLATGFTERGIPAEFVRYPRSYHGLSRTGPPWLLVDRLERIRTWFAHWIGTGDAPPAAAGSLR